MELNEKIKDLQELGMRNKIRQWEPFMRKHGCNIIAEVGVSKGRNFLSMIEHEPKVAIAVDSWVEDGTPSRNDRGYTQQVLDEQYAYMKKLSEERPFIKVYREYSFNVVKGFSDDYFDFVYIDADHTYNGCLKDINDWYPKVKKGGVLVGDDYIERTVPWTGVEFGVINAVNTFIKDNDLTVFELPRYGWGILK